MRRACRRARRPDTVHTQRQRLRDGGPGHDGRRQVAMFGAAAVHPVPVIRPRRGVKHGRLCVSRRRDVPAQQKDTEKKVCFDFYFFIILTVKIRPS